MGGAAGTGGVAAPRSRGIGGGERWSFAASGGGAPDTSPGGGVAVRCETSSARSVLHAATVRNSIKAMPPRTSNAALVSRWLGG